MNEEQAINYIGKTVYVVDYHTDEISTRKIKGAEEVSNKTNYQYRLVDTNGKQLIIFFDTWELAHESLVDYCEKRVDIEMLRLNGVMEMVGV